MKKKVPKEHIIESYFVRKIKANFPNAQVHKYEIRKGEPDRICLLPGGRTVFVELKRPGEEPREDQLRAIKRLTALGFPTFWTDTKEGVDKIIEELKNESKN